ncbi:diaminopimelate epimerase [Clostridium pascui]|uniref:diaminopimelate epimerase n=1 Tax=Clostridium pascui TaxID=46609 RepID=UPI00195AD5AB|nr:diaminopimelate epimerase [Clostridium pascui]MBM7870029.1 diaminopimelate epimerase [Clostridium pascui]
MTVFIKDSLPRKIHKDVAKEIMQYGNVYAEQVGFIETPVTEEGKKRETLRLQMMGGEFCGNAARSLAAYMVYSSYPGLNKFQDKYLVELEVSGAKDMVLCEVSPTQKSNEFYSKINMPLPLGIDEITFNYENGSLNISKVELPGITHFIVYSDGIKNKESFFEEFKSKSNLDKLDAFGIMFYEPHKNFLEPLVYVRETESLFWERSCVSGTTALAYALSYDKKENLNIEVNEPGGKLLVHVNWHEEKIKSIRLDGKVTIVAEGTLHI